MLFRSALLERRIAFLSSVFTVDVVELMPMGNHVHLVVRTHPELAWCLDDEEVVRRWSLLALAGRDGTEVPESWRPSESEVRRAASDAPRVAVLRRRLGERDFGQSPSGVVVGRAFRLSSGRGLGASPIRG